MLKVITLLNETSFLKYKIELNKSIVGKYEIKKDGFDHIDKIEKKAIAKYVNALILFIFFANTFPIKINKNIAKGFAKIKVGL
jgi:hypothetical protein